MDIYSTGVLARVVAALPAPAPFILNSFFRTMQTETSEDIHFDVDSGKRRLAPFVAPIVAGKVVASRGFTTQTFKPAYVKDKRVFDANGPFKRAIGERIGGDMSPAERLQARLGFELNDQLEMLTRRQEVMACEALRTGKVTVAGDEYPSVEVNFGRASALSVDISGGGSAWGQAGVKPLRDVEAWSMLVTKNSGATANTVIMDVDAWQKFSDSTEVQKLLDRFRGRDALNPTVTGEGGRYMGSTGDLDIWVYAGWYLDPADGVTLKPYLPSNTVIVTGPDLEGARAFGAIRDEKAGFQAMPFYSKSWVDEDPAVRYLLMQSAPLPVPYRVNASLGAKVA